MALFEVLSICRGIKSLGRIAVSRFVDGQRRSFVVEVVAISTRFMESRVTGNSKLTCFSFHVICLGMFHVITLYFSWNSGCLTSLSYSFSLNLKMEFISYVGMKFSAPLDGLN